MVEYKSIEDAVPPKPLGAQIYYAYRASDVSPPTLDEALNEYDERTVIAVYENRTKLTSCEDLYSKIEEVGADMDAFVFEEVDSEDLAAVCEEVGISSAGKWICFAKGKSKSSTKGLPETIYFNK